MGNMDRSSLQPQCHDLLVVPINKQASKQLQVQLRTQFYNSELNSNIIDVTTWPPFDRLQYLYNHRPERAMMNKSRPLMGKRTPSPDAINDVCPHQHFKSDTIDRNFLSRKQHLNLLCTPKGYRWMIKKAHRLGAKSPYFAPDPCKLSRKKPGKTYVHNILAEMWDLITPEMVQHMKQTLITEFGLSEECDAMGFRAALDFICHSRHDTSLIAQQMAREADIQDKSVGGKGDRPPEGSTIPCLAAAQKLCKNDFNIDVNPFHIREFSNAVSSKLSNYVVAMTCAKRDSKHRIMAETILRGLCDLTGEETTLDSPKNRLHKIMTVSSDRLALWLVGNMEDEDKTQAKKRKREDKALKRKTLARRRQQKNRQKEKDRINKENQKNEKRRAEEEAQKKKLADEEKYQKKAEREERHKEMQKFREEEKQKQKEELKKAKEQTEAAKSKRDQGGEDGSKPTGYKPVRSNVPKNEQSKKEDLKPGSKGQLISKTAAPPRNQAKSQLASKTGSRKSNPAANALSSGNQPVKAGQVNRGTKVPDKPPPMATRVQPITKKAETASQSGDTKTKTREFKKDISKVSQVSASKSIAWGNDRVKSISSAFSAPEKIITASSKSSSVDKLVQILSSQGKTASSVPSQDKTAAYAAVISQEDVHTSHGSQSILAKVISSQGELMSEHTSYLNLGTISASEDKLATTESKKRKESILTVKRTISESFEIHRTTYAEAKQKIGAVKRGSTVHIVPPTVPFDSNDPKSWAQWVEYITQMAEEWGRWIDKTIQDTEDKAITYQAKVKEGKTEPEDVEDWNRFVERTYEDAKRWRRRRKAMLDAAKEWKSL